MLKAGGSPGCFKWLRTIAASFLFLSAGMNSVTSQDDAQIGIDVSDVEIAAEGVPTAPTVERVPVISEFIPIGRVEGDLGRLRTMKELVSRSPCGEVLREELWILQLVDEVESQFPGENFQSLRFSYEGLLGLTGEPDGEPCLVILAVAQLSRESTLRMLHAEASGGSVELTETDDPDILAFDGNYLCFADGYVALLAGDSLGIVDQVPDHKALMLGAVERMRRLDSVPAFRIAIDPSGIRRPLRTEYLHHLLAGLGTQMQIRDDEDPLEFRMREAWTKPLASLLQIAFTEIDAVQFSIDVNDDTESCELLLDVATTKGSVFDGWLQDQQSGRSRLLGMLHPDHSGFISFSLSVPESLRQSLPALGAAIGDAMRNQTTITGRGVDEIQAAFGAMAAAERFDLLVQLIPAADGGQDVFLTIPATDAVDLSSTAIELVTLETIDGLQVAAMDVDGWPVHRWTGAAQDLRHLLQVEDIQLIATDQHITLHLCTPRGHHLISDVVRHDYDPHPRASRFSRSGISGEFSWVQHLFLGDLGLRNADERAPEAGSEAGSESTQAHDDCFLYMDNTPQHLTLRMTCGPDAAISGVLCYTQVSMLLVMAFEDLL